MPMNIKQKTMQTIDFFLSPPRSFFRGVSGNISVGLKYLQTNISGWKNKKISQATNMIDNIVSQVQNAIQYAVVTILMIALMKNMANDIFTFALAGSVVLFPLWVKVSDMISHQNGFSEVEKVGGLINIISGISSALLSITNALINTAVGFGQVAMKSLFVLLVAEKFSILSWVGLGSLRMPYVAASWVFTSMLLTVHMEYSNDLGPEAYTLLGAALSITALKAAGLYGLS